jgi:hypothetical protein
MRVVEHGFLFVGGRGIFWACPRARRIGPVEVWVEKRVSPLRCSRCGRECFGRNDGFGVSVTSGS